MTTDERLAAIETKLDRVLVLLEPKAAPVPQPEPARNGSAPNGDPDENGVIWPKKVSVVNCKRCHAECIWGWDTKLREPWWRPYEPTAPFEKHNCAKRAKQDSAGDLLPGGGANDITRRGL